MVPILPDRIPWFVAGPMIGLLVVGLYAVANQRLGVTTSYHSVASLVFNRAKVEPWRIWFFVGLAAGACLATLLQGRLSFSLDYGAIGLLLPIGVLLPILFVGGLLMGYGARWAGGCTSGHGISGNASLSPASFAATVTFMASAIGVTFLIHALTGGAL